MVDFADMSSRTRIRMDLMNVCIRDEIKHPVSCDRIRKFDSEVVDQDFSVNPETVPLLFLTISTSVYSLDDEA